MRQVLSDQRLRSHPCLVATYDVTGKNAAAVVELYALGRQAKSHIIVQQLCEVRSDTHTHPPHTRVHAHTRARKIMVVLLDAGRRPVPIHPHAPAVLRATRQVLLQAAHRRDRGDARQPELPWGTP